MFNFFRSLMVSGYVPLFVESYTNAGWAFRQVLSDLGPRVLDDAEMLKELAEAEAIGFLDVGSLNRDCAIRMSQAIEDLVSGILAGSIRSGIADNFPDDAGMNGSMMQASTAEISRET